MAMGRRPGLMAASMRAIGVMGSHMASARSFIQTAIFIQASSSMVRLADSDAICMSTGRIISASGLRTYKTVLARKSSKMGVSSLECSKMG